MRFLLSPLLFTAGALAIGQRSLVNFNASGIPLASQDSFVTINADPNDWPAVLGVCDDLAMDFGRVTGANGSVVLRGDGGSAMNASMIFGVTGRASFGITSKAAMPGGTIITGTMGHSSLIDSLAAEGKLNLTEIDGIWESDVSSVAQHPMPGVSEALVIAGSDRRGTIFRLYSISEQIIHANNMTMVQGAPSIKYCGFFINDEAPAFVGWIDAKVPPSPWGPRFGGEYYSLIFELLLRLRGN